MSECGPQENCPNRYEIHVFESRSALAFPVFFRLPSHMKSSFALFGIGLLSIASTTMNPARAAPLLRTGDRIVFLGNTLIERARLYGQIEAALSVTAGPSVRDLTFRNLGWSADSVFSDSRSYFGPPQEGRDRLAANLQELKPTVIFLAYGTGEAMSVDQGWTNEPEAAAVSASGMAQSLSLFESGYQKLIDSVRNAAGESLREMVLLSPPPLENLGPPLPDQIANNRRIAAFRDVIGSLAEKNEIRFVDLFAALGGDERGPEIVANPLTNNGVHFTGEGYAVVARALVKELGLDESVLATASPQAKEAFRDAIVEKNRLFFHRWRPANETYLFLFRKHEQGQNAKEIPMFDPLIREQEKRIAEAREAVLSAATKN